MIEYIHLFYMDPDSLFYMDPLESCQVKRMSNSITKDNLIQLIHYILGQRTT